MDSVVRAAVAPPRDFDPTDPEARRARDLNTYNTLIEMARDLNPNLPNDLSNHVVTIKIGHCNGMALATASARRSTP